MIHFEHVNATSIEEALTYLGEDGRSRLVAGGTDLLTELKLDMVTPGRLINIKTIPSLEEIRFEDRDGLRIGALATLASMAEENVVRERYRVLWEAVSSAATLQLRNRATIAGNLLQDSRCWYYRGPFDCWLKGGGLCYAREGESAHHAIFAGGPCYTVHPSDPAPALIALEAEIEIVGKEGKRTIPIEAIFQKPEKNNRRMTNLRPSEIIVGIRAATPPSESRGTYLKAMERAAWGFAQASAAAQITFEADVVRKTRLVLGGVAPIPWRVPDAEAAIQDRRLDDELIGHVAEICVAGAQPLSRNEYKIPLVKGLVTKALTRLRRG
jgi:xanthine dehydrogenase YagS FAD-binding subunit